MNLSQTDHWVDVTIHNRKGLHARPSARLVKLAESFSSDIYLTYQQLHVSAKSIMGILMLGARYGATIKIHAQGADALEALTALKELVTSKFGEE